MRIHMRINIYIGMFDIRGWISLNTHLYLYHTNHIHVYIYILLVILYSYGIAGPCIDESDHDLPIKHCAFPVPYVSHRT
jgi:hypothetical protein